MCRLSSDCCPLLGPVKFLGAVRETPIVRVRTWTAVLLCGFGCARPPAAAGTNPRKLMCCLLL